LGSRAGSGGHLYRQGGNLPFFRRLPFMRGEGFTPPARVEFNEVNLDQLARFQAGTVVSPATLAEAKLLHRPGNPVAILGNGEIKVALTVQVHRVTKSAKAKIEKAGGKIELIA
jgi:large subunit ribosomal protein L15